ncbi:hypothetical protein [Rouxiella sp. WC2420]|uniref:Uncharacterized protein n=1 Tax=Rouxiella sp. WC2420 TaxID=3234145 RepID=A0AB39VWL1_9GAMM
MTPLLDSLPSLQALCPLTAILSSGGVISDNKLAPEENCAADSNSLSPMGTLTQHYGIRKVSATGALLALLGTRVFILLAAIQLLTFLASPRLPARLDQQKRFRQNGGVCRQNSTVSEQSKTL